jgi:hypothetical protein
MIAVGFEKAPSIVTASPLRFSGDSPSSSFTGTCPLTIKPRSVSQPNSASTFRQKAGSWISSKYGFFVS